MHLYYSKAFADAGNTLDVGVPPHLIFISVLWFSVPTVIPRASAKRSVSSHHTDVFSICVLYNNTQLSLLRSQCSAAGKDGSVIYQE